MHTLYIPQEGKFLKQVSFFKKHSIKNITKNTKIPALLGFLYVLKDIYYYGPSDWNRTSGLLNPIQARYQSAPHPDINFLYFIILNFILSTVKTPYLLDV